MGFSAFCSLLCQRRFEGVFHSIVLFTGYKNLISDIKNYVIIFRKSMVKVLHKGLRRDFKCVIFLLILLALQETALAGVLFLRTPCEGCAVH